MSKFRHWLIRKLSCGDMILLNFEIRSDGSFINRNCGSSLISEADVTGFEADYCVFLGRGMQHGKSALSLAVTQGLTVSNSLFRCIS